MNQIQSAFFSLSKNDFLKGLVVFVLAAVFTYLAQLFNVAGFSFTGIDWGQIGQIALMAGISYLAKNLVTNSNGQVFGFIGKPNTSS